MMTRRPRGSGSITYDARRDAYRIRWPIPGDPRGGQRYVTGSRIDADRALRDELNARDAGRGVIDRRTTLNAWLDEWLSSHVAAKSEGTRDHYADLCDRVIRPALGRRKLVDITPLELSRFKSDMVRAGRSRRGADAVLDILSAALGYAVRMGALDANPRSKVARELRVARPIRPPSRAEVDALLADAAADPDPRWLAIYGLAIGHGLRESEILGLQRGDRSSDGLRLTIWRKANGRTGNLAEEPKDGSVRSFVLLPWVASALDALGPGVPGALYFPNRRRTRPLNPKLVLEHVNAASRRLELARVYGVHDLRRAYGTRLAQDGASPALIQQRMGHRDYRTSLVYIGELEHVDSLTPPAAVVDRLALFDSGAAPLSAPLRARR